MIATFVPLALAALLLIGLERVPVLRRLRLRLYRSFFLTDVAWLILGYVATQRLALAYVAWGSDALGAAGLPRLSLPLWAATLVSLVLLDLGNYAGHVLLHRVEALWEFHKVHHSSRKLDWLATFRSHLLEQLLRRLVAPLLLIVVGVPLEAVALAATLFLIWAMLNHANLRVELRWLEPLFITPRLHLRHHGTTTSDKNLGTLFSIWDRLLGRLDTSEAPADVELGVPGEVESYPQTLAAQFPEPFRRCRARLAPARRSAA